MLREVSVDLALEMIEREVVNIPYQTSVKQRSVAPQTVMVNAGDLEEMR